MKLGESIVHWIHWANEQRCCGRWERRQ